MKKLLTLAALIFAVSASTLSFAQKPLLYGVQNGLASTQITDINIDNDNFLWVATRSGLSRFDGQSFSNYIGDSSNPYMLSSNHITCTYFDSNNEFWVGTNAGLFHFDHSLNKFTSYGVDRDFTKNIAISCMTNIEGKPNLILIGTSGYGLYIFNTETFRTEEELTEAYNNAFGESYITAIQNDNYGNHWIIGTQWFSIINPKTGTEIVPECNIPIEKRNSIVIQGHTVEPKGSMLYLGTVSDGILQCNTLTHEVKTLDIPAFNKREMFSLFALDNNRIMVGTEGSGLWELNTKTLEVTRLRYPQCPIDLDYAKIHGIIADKQGNIWLNVYQKGVMEVPTSGRLFNCLPIKATTISEHNLSNVSAFAELQDGTRIFGLDGGGIVTESPSGELNHYSTENTIFSTNAIISLKSTDDGNTFIGTYNHGLYILDKNHNVVRDAYLSSLDLESIMCMDYKPENKTLYIGTNGSGVLQYNLETHQLSQLVRTDGTRWIVSLYADHNNNLWIGTEGTLTKYDLNKGIDDGFKSPGAIRIFNLQNDTNGNLWFIADKGLYKYDYSTQELSNIRLNTLPGEVYATMAISEDDEIWIASNFGITNYSPKAFKSIRYNSPDITEVGSFSIRAAMMWSTGSIGFGGDNGMVIFKAEDIEAFDYKLSPVYFTRLWVNNVITDYNPRLSKEENVMDKALWCASELRLPISSNSFSLSFTVQEFRTPIDIYYSYRLSGYEETWHEVQGVNQTLSYSSLPAGKYTLTVTAHQGNDPNNEPQTKDLVIIIYQPWYLSTWAILGYVVIFALLISLITSIISRRHQRAIIRRRLKDIEDEEDAKEEDDDDDDYDDEDSDYDSDSDNDD